MNLLNARISQLENGDVVIRPSLFWVCCSVGGALLMAVILCAIFIFWQSLLIPLFYIVLPVFTMLAMMYLGWSFQYRHFVSFEKEVLRVLAFGFNRAVLPKNEVIAFSYKKGPDSFFVLKSTKKIKIHDLDPKTISREFKKWKHQ